MVGDVTSVGDTFAHYQLDTVLDNPAAIAADTYLATDTRSGTTVVLEILRATATSVERARFGTRGRRLQSVSEPSLFSIRELAPTHCALDAPMGRPVAEHAGIAIARARQKLFWLSQVAGALAALHKHGIVHGALSLASITVSSESVDSSSPRRAPLALSLAKLSVPIAGAVTGSPLDDVRALARVTCELLLGLAVGNDVEQASAERLQDAGVPMDTALVIARVRAGGSMTSTDLAEKLAAFSDYIGPMTEPLLPVAPRHE
jgi:serine/threonine protein kinase